MMGIAARMANNTPTVASAPMVLGDRPRLPEQAPQAPLRRASRLVGILRGSKRCMVIQGRMSAEEAQIVGICVSGTGSSQLRTENLTGLK